MADDERTETNLIQFKYDCVIVTSFLFLFFRAIKFSHHHFIMIFHVYGCEVPASILKIGKEFSFSDFVEINI